MAAIILGQQRYFDLLMTNVGLNFAVYSSNIQSIVSIYNDSEKIRQQKASELEERLKIKTWTNEEFEEYNHYKFHFDWLLMQSLFISGFSYFENYMRSTATLIEKDKGDKIKLNDIRGTGILDTYRKYIYLIGDIQSASSDTIEWKAILEFKEIRNAIIHYSGQIKRKINKVIEHDIYFGPSEKLIRIKNIKFLEDFVTTATSYMVLVSNEIEEKNCGSQQ